MAGATAKIPMPCPNELPAGQYSGEPKSVGFAFLEFLEEAEEPPEGSCNSKNNGFDDDDHDHDEGEFKDDDVDAQKMEESKAFWETQNKLLKTCLARTSSVESRIKQVTSEAIREMESGGMGCACGKAVSMSSACRNCMQREIWKRLRGGGYDCAICKSKWRSSREIPSGEHTYLEVVAEKSSSKKGEVMRVVIELNFRGEFEIARATEEYDGLTRQLPQVFVGKAERLRKLIRTLCAATKRCMKEKKMHMAPWRKQKYMEAKWSGSPTSEPKAALAPPILSLTPSSVHQLKRRASMLTVDLLDNLPALHRSAIRVV